MFTLMLDDAAFMSDAASASNDLERATDAAASNAADEGVRAEQENHPYTDRTRNLTGSAHVEPANGNEPGFDMVWPAEYASFVNDGTERAKAFPFVPIAEKRADRVLKYDLANAVDAFKDKLSG